MDSYEFLAAPNESFWYNAIPSGGYKLVEPGEGFVPAEGGRFREPKKGDDRRLLLPVGKVERGSDPFVQDDGEALFSVFARLETEKDILGFASLNGNLRGGISASPGSGLEPIAWWYDEIHRIRMLVEAKEAFESGEGMERFIHDLDEEHVLFQLPGALAREKVRKGASGGVFLRGMVQTVNEVLKGNLSPQYALDGEGKVHSVLRPRNLVTAIWLSFAWGFFKDGPRERTWERCYKSGRYFHRWKREEVGKKGKALTNLFEKKNGPHKGLFYHPKVAARERALKHYHAHKSTKKDALRT